MEKELTQNNKDKWIWKRTGAYKVLELTKEGRSISEITKAVGWKEQTVWNFISSPTFLKKLEEHLKSVLFEFQKNRVLALNEITELLWNVVMGRKQVEGLTPNQAAGHLVKILNLRGGESTVINPRTFHIIMNISKTEPEKSRDLAEEFGFADLLPEGEKSETSPE